jgi:tetratricopeptide (TPR) repeat protein
VPDSDDVERLISEVLDALAVGRYQLAVSIAGRAAQTAEELDDPGRLARALAAEADALMKSGEHLAAMALYIRVMALAEDPDTRYRLDNPHDPKDLRPAQAVARAHMNWVACARFMTDIPYHELFAVLDDAENWLAETGHRDWRATVLLERAKIHHRLGNTKAAVDTAEEALAAYRHGTPGYPLAAYRITCGDTLRAAGEHAEARSCYQDIFDDPSPGTSPDDWAHAHEGLARCALAVGDPGTARRHAATAVTRAEDLGDDALCAALDALVEACRATPNPDLDAAWQAATRQLEAARRVGGHLRPYYAIRAAIDVAVDRCDLHTARSLLTDLDRHTAAMDEATGDTAYTIDAAKRRQRLVEAETEHCQEPGSGTS